jgi:hypothetical protein
VSRRGTTGCETITDPAAQLRHLIDELKAIIHVTSSQTQNGIQVVRFIAISALTRIGQDPSNDPHVPTVP